MAKVKIDIGAGSQDSIGDLSSMDGVSPIIVNAFKNLVGSDIRRPGFELHATPPLLGAIDGIYWSHNLELLIIVSVGNIYKFNTDNSTVTTIKNGLMEIGTPVSFTEDGTRILMANGGKIVYTEGVTAAAVTDINAPTTTHSLDFMDDKVIASDGTKVYYSDVNNSLSWPALGFITPSTNWDGPLRVIVHWREVFIFSRNSIDVYAFDSSGSLQRLAGAFIQSGILAPHSLVSIDQALIYLNRDRKFVILQGRQEKEISQPYDRQLQDLSTVEDAIAHKVEIAGQKFYVVTFPTENFTLAFDYVLNQWYQWGKWDTINGKYDRLMVNCFTVVPEVGRHFAGGTDGKIYEFTRDYYKDGTGPLRYLRRTGHITHGTYDRKVSSALYIKVRRGSGDVADPKMQIRWQDNGSENWTNWKEISLGKDGKQYHIVRLNRTGIYRTRQYEIACSDAVPFELANPIEEDVEVNA